MAPSPRASRLTQRNDPTCFSVATVEGKLALWSATPTATSQRCLLEATATAATRQTGRTQNAPLAVGTIAGIGQQYAVVADQNLDQVSVYFRNPGTDQFDSPVPVNSQTQPLLAPGAVQLFAVPGDPDPYLLVVYLA